MVSSGVVFVFLSLLIKNIPQKSMYFNLSSSTPLGLYRVTSPANIKVGDLVIFYPPKGAHPFIYGRRWLPDGWPLLKSVGALEGDIYCVLDDSFFINRKYVGPVFKRDREGMVLPSPSGCHNVGRETFLPVSTHITHSFDGRYFGPVAMAAIRGKAIPVWTY